MLIIFDVDGTLVAGEEHDWAAFDRSLERHLGFNHPPGFFAALQDVTAENVFHAVARAMGREATEEVKEHVRQGYLAGLRAAHAAYADAFPARPGVPSLLAHLATVPGCTVAVATGDWRPTISFKLQCAGIDVSRYPMATSSDTARRADIIRLAAERAGRPLSEAVYVGDGAWDLRACRELGVPFIGTGARLERLRAAGAEHLCEPLDVGRFLVLVAQARLGRGAIAAARPA